jgi:hypothetical protein
MRAKSYLQRLTKSRHALPMALIVLGVILANSVYIAGYLTGKADPNPIFQKSGLAIQKTRGKIGGQNTIDPNDGFTTQALGHLSANDWLHGKMPYWNHYEGVGTPLAGEMQSAAFFPLTLLLRASSGLLLFHIVLEIIAGVATYFLLIKLRINRKIAIFGGIAFALNGTFAWLTNAAFNPIAFLPLLLLGIESAYQATIERKKRSCVLISLAIALSLYAGFPETAYINGLLGVVWAATRFFQLKRAEFRKDFVRQLMLGGAVGILLAAPILVAFYDYLKYANVGLHGGRNTSSIVPIGLSSLFMPYIFGPIFGQYIYDVTGQLGAFWSSVGGYITTSLIVLAGFGVTGKRDRPLKLILGAWAVITIFRTYGFFWLGHLLSFIPGIGTAAFYRYVVPSFEFSIVVLAAFGIDELANKRISTRKKIVIAAIMAVIITGGILNAIPELHRLALAPVSHWWAALSILTAIGSVLLIFGTQFLKGRGIRQYALATIALCEIGVMFLMPQLSTPRHRSIDTQPVNFLQKNIGEFRFATLGPIEPNYGSYYKISSININDLPIPKNYSEYVKDHLDKNVDPLIFTGTVMSDPKGSTPLESFLQNFESYQEVGVKYLVAPPGLVPAQAAASKSMNKVFTGAAADIYELPNPKPYFEILEGKCLLYPNGKDELMAKCAKPSKLIRRELFMKGWTAKVGKKALSMEEYSKLFQEIDLPSGDSHIIFYYSPPHIIISYFLMTLGAVAIGAFIARDHFTNLTLDKNRRPVATHAKRLK